MKTPAPWRGAGGGADRNKKSLKSDSTSPLHPQVTDRNLVLGHLRAVWWSQWREGVRLPAERGVILVDGDLT